MPSEHAYLQGWIYIPLSKVPDLRALQRTLTVQPKGFKDYEPPKPIPCYNMDKPGYVGVPIDWGFQYLPESMTILDKTSAGRDVVFPKEPDPNHPLAPPGQEKFITDLHAAMLENSTVLAKAGTGTGKTVAAMAVSAKIGKTTLVQVHLQRLMKQWVKQGMDKLGLSKDQIGIVQGPKCDWRDKPLVIAMMPTLSQRTFEPEFYDAFGIVWQDEVHKVGSKQLAECLGQFNAMYKGALTATVDRRDGAEVVYTRYYGPPRVVSVQKTQPITIHPVEYKRRKGTFTKGNRAIWIRQLVSDERRNQMLAFYTYKLYEAGHRVLGVSESIDHLDAIAAILMKDHGVKSNQIGFHTDSHNDPETGKRVKTTEAYFEWVAEKPDFVLGTYGTLTEGVDIPTLSGGVDYIPRSKFKQLLGRVRRLLPGKLPAEWYTPIDVDFPSFKGAYFSRLKDIADDKEATIGKVRK